MSGMPTIRLEVEGMVYAIYHQLNNSHAELENMIEKVFRELDIEEIIRNEIELLMPKLIQASIQQTVRGVIQDEVYSFAQQHIRPVVLQSIKDALPKEGA